MYVWLNLKTIKFYLIKLATDLYWQPSQGILKREASLYHWPPVWLVWNQLYGNWHFLFLFSKPTYPNQSNRRFTVQWCFPLLYSLTKLFTGWKSLIVLNIFLENLKKFLWCHYFSISSNFKLTFLRESCEYEPSTITKVSCPY